MKRRLSRDIEAIRQDNAYRYSSGARDLLSASEIEGLCQEVERLRALLASLETPKVRG